MIQQQTLLKVADNSGAKTVKCINVLGGFKRKFAFLGDVILVSVKELRNASRINSKVSQGEVHKAIVIRTKNKKINKDGLMYFFNENTVVLLNKQGKPFATRIFGPIPKKLKFNQLMKLASLSSGFF
nr:ribosomal protein L14 [Stephanopyxis turris]